MPEELSQRRSWRPPVMIQIEGNQPQAGQLLAKFFCGFFQQFTFANAADSPNTQDWWSVPRLRGRDIFFESSAVHLVDRSQSFEEMVQKLSLMVSIGKEFQGRLSCYPPAGGPAGFT